MSDAPPETGSNQLGETVLGMMDRLAERYGAEVEVGQVVVICEVANGERRRVEVFSSDPRAWTVYGLCAVAGSAQLGHINKPD